MKINKNKATAILLGYIIFIAAATVIEFLLELNIIQAEQTKEKLLYGGVLIAVIAITLLIGRLSEQAIYDSLRAIGCSSFESDDQTTVFTFWFLLVMPIMCFVMAALRVAHFSQLTCPCQCCK
jgi:hypothetical protein